MVITASPLQAAMEKITERALVTLQAAACTILPAPMMTPIVSVDQDWPSTVDPTPLLRFAQLFSETAVPEVCLCLTELSWRELIANGAVSPTYGLLLEHEVHGALVVPLRHGKQYYGTWVIYHRMGICDVGTNWLEDNWDWINGFCCQIILALESYRLHRKLTHHTCVARRGTPMFLSYDSVNQLLFSARLIGESVSLTRYQEIELKQWVRQLSAVTGSALTMIQWLSQQISECEVVCQQSVDHQE
jgi:hypothetical protein